MAIRIILEYGHASVLRAHLTPEGYTHDWEVFVRGVDNADIHQYIDKVVFLLHDSFRNPKRVLKEPPFMVKESGWAGFIIPIEIYLKNKDEPKKFQIAYDLNLQTSGPPVTTVLRHTEIINNPSDEFRKKLLKGGGVLISNRDSLLEKGDAKPSTMVGKPKLSGSSEAKKHRITESKTSNSFHDLFGPPIKTAKISPDSKKTIQSDKNSVTKPLAPTEKSDKIEKTIKAKESPHKDSKKDKDEKKDKKARDSSKDKLKNKEKSKRPSSPGSKSHSSPVSKRSTSPVVIKKPLSPLPPSTKRPPSPKPKEKELKKIAPEKERDNKERDKIKNNSKSIIDSSKSEKKKDKKKHKEDRDREKREKYKEAEKTTGVKDVAKITDKKPEKTDKTEKPEKEKSQEYKSSSKDGRKSPKIMKENDRVRDDKIVKVDKSDKTEKTDKIKDHKNDKERPKHKHKKRDKKDKRDNNKDKERKEKRDRSKDAIEKQNNVSSAPSGNPLSALLAEIPEKDSSDSTPSVDDDLLSESKSVSNKDTEHATIPSLSAETTKPLSPSMSIEMKKDRGDRNRKDKSKGSRGEERESRKRKRRSESKGDDEVPVKRDKDRGHSTSPPLEPVSSSQSPVAIDVDSVHYSEKEKKENKKEKDTRDVVGLQAVNEKDNENDAEQVAPDSTNSTLVDADIGEPPVFSEDYVSQLKELQQKIMTLQDNQELQRVVQVIAETGQYEITKKTFDFDLCALDRRTVQRLQQFFSAS